MKGNTNDELEKLKLTNFILTNALISIKQLESISDRIKDFINLSFTSPVLTDSLTSLIEERSKVIDFIYEDPCITNSINEFEGELITMEALNIMNQDKENRDGKA
tara:strand:- start:6073 stop:6387 length:315 start_codon:yes stop_codon:yes gene_type:complete